MAPRLNRLLAVLTVAAGLARAGLHAEAPPQVTPPADQVVAEGSAPFVVNALVSPGHGGEAVVSVSVSYVPNDIASVTADTSGLPTTNPATPVPLTITPLPDSNGVVTVVLTATDSGGDVSDPATFTITVTAANNPPAFSSVPQTTATEDTPYSYLVTATDPDPGQTLAITAPVAPAWLTLIDNGNGTATLTGTPANANVGSHAVTLRVSDGALTADQNFTVVVANVNDPPSITDLADTSVAEDSSTGPLSFTVTDIDATDVLTVTAVASDTTLLPPGSLSLSGTGGARTLTVTPAPNASGSATVTVTVTDLALASASDSFLLTVTPVNDPPAFTSAPVTAATEDTPYLYPITTTDLDQSPALTISAPVAPAWLTLTDNGNGTATLAGTPTNADTGDHPVTLRVSDGLLFEDQTFTLNVSPVDDPPVVGAIDAQSMAEDGILLVPITVSDQDSDLSTVVVTATSSDTAVVANSGLVVAPQSGSARVLTVTPVANATTAGGPVTVTVVASVGASTSAPVTFLITVTEVNDLPALSGVPEQQVDQDGGPTPPAAFTVQDVETAAAALQVSANSSNPALLPVANIVLGGSGGSRTVSVQPAPGQSGTSTVTLTVSDGASPPGTAQTTFLVRVNGRPTLSDIPDQNTQEDTPLAGVAFTVGDAETAAGNLVVTRLSSNETLVPSSNVQVLGTDASRTLSITPAANESGTSTITVTVFDGALTASDSFVLTVNAVNDLPQISTIAAQSTPEDVPLGPVSFTVSDQETSAVALTLSADSSNAALLPLTGIAFGGSGGTRTVTLTPAQDATGQATVTLTVTDADGGQRSTSFALDVVAVQDAPSVNPIDDVTTQEDVAAVVSVVVADVDTPLASVTLSATSSNTGVVAPGGIAFEGTGGVRTLRLTPVANASGVTDITVTAWDGTLSSASRTFRLTVRPLNDVPTISAITNQTTDEDTATGALPFTVGDVETAADALTVSAASNDTTLLPLANIALGGSGASRTVTLTPAPNQSGTAQVTLTVSDGTASTPMSFQLTVNAVNDVPTISDIGNASTPQDIAAGPLAFTVGDIETAAAVLGVSATSSDQAVIPNSGITFGGSGANRTITLVPASGKTGSSTVTVTVSDGSRQSSDAFVLTVNPPNAPTITGLPATSTTQEDTATGAIAFSIADIDGTIGPVTAVSSNSSLVPNDSTHIVIAGGPGVGGRTITLVPAADQSGTTTITVTVQDHTLNPALTAVASLTVNVSPVNDAPTLGAIDNRTVNEDTVTPVPLVVNDVDPGDTLTVTASSSNAALVANPPSPGLAATGSGSSRTLTVTPVANASGTTTISVQVSDGVAAPTTRQFVLTVNAVNDAPTVGAVGNRTTQEDVPLGPIAFSIGDVETAAAALTLSASSSDTTLLPVANIAFGGFADARTITMTPAPNRFGAADVTVTVSDGALSTPTTFTLTVTPVNDPPTLAAIPAQAANEDSSRQVALALGDVDDDPAALLLSATASDTELVPPAALAFSGTGPNRVLTVTPAANRFGVATITVTVRDDEAPIAASASRAFEFQVTPVNDPPTVSDVPPQQTQEDVPIGPIAFTVGDVDDDVTTLNVTATSSDQSVVRNTGIQLGGSGTARSLTIQPEFGASGSTTITLTVGDGEATAVDTFTLDVSNVPCAYTVTAAPLALSAAGGLVRVLVDTNRASCSWAVTSGAVWAAPVNHTPPAYGDGAVDVAVAANASAQPRSTVVTVAGSSFTLTQAGASVCTYGLTPASQALGSPGGTAAVSVTATGSGCGTWTVSSGAQWLSVTSGATGTGAGTVALAVAPNTGEAARTATLTLQPGGATAALTQAGASPCQYTVAPDRLAFGAAGGARALSVQTAGGAGQCAWSLAFAGAPSWLALSTTGGFGNGAVTVTASDNSAGAPRSATLVLRDASGNAALSVVTAQDSPTGGDADGDGLPSAWEVQFGLDAQAAAGENGADGDPDADGVSNLEEQRNCERPVGCTHPRGFDAHARYLAEGATSTFFETRLALLNPGDETATVLLRFQKADGSSATQYAALPPRARRTMLASSVDGLQQAEFSTLVESDAQIVVDRTMTWDRSGYGSHAETALGAPRTRWYFAEGATFGTFDLFYLLQNPGDTDAEVQVRFLLASGPPVVRTYRVPAATRFNIWVDTFPELAGVEVSGVVESTNGVPILAERAMYSSAPTRPFVAGHESAAVAEPALSWFLAEGATGSYFDTFVLVANPSDERADVEARYLLPDGTVITRAYQVAANSRLTIWVDLEDPRLESAAVSTAIASTNGVPVIVERAMWWPGPTADTWSEAHNAAGTTVTGTAWALAEGEQGGPARAETYLLVANTSGVAGEARVTLLFEDGTSARRTFTLPPNSRTNVAVSAEFPEASDTRFGAIVESLGASPAQLVVERAMYTSADGVQWSAGTSAVATKLR
jgi:hypothetical protein